MANNIGSLAVQITGNSAGLTKALHAAETGVKHSMGKIAAIATGVGGGLFAGFKLGSFITDSIKIAGEMEDIASSFKTMTGDAEEGEKLFRDIEDASDAMRMNVKDTAEAAKGLFSADVAADQIVPTLRLLGDLALGDAEKLKTLSQAYSKVVDDGEVSSRTMRAFAGANVFLASEIAKGMGLDKSGFKQALEDGKVGLRDLQVAMIAATSEGGKFFGATEKKLDTFKGKVETLGNMWEDFKWKFGEVLIDELGLKGLVDSLTAGLGIGKDNLDGIRPILKDIKTMAEDFGKAMFTALRNSAIAAAELIDLVNRLDKGGSSVLDLTGANGPTKLERFGSLGGWLDEIANDKSDPNEMKRSLGWFGPGGGAWGSRQLFQKGNEGPGDSLTNAGKTKNFFDAAEKEMKNAFAGVGKGASGSWYGEMINMTTQVKKTSDAFKIAEKKTLAKDMKFVDELGAKSNPVGQMMKEFDEVLRMSKQGLFGGKGPEHEQALSDIFNKFVGDFKSTVQLSGVALQDSIEAVSAIANNKIGGPENLPARAAAAAEQALQLHKQAAIDRGIMARAMIDLADKIKKEALP